MYLGLGWKKTSISFQAVLSEGNFYQLHSIRLGNREKNLENLESSLFIARQLPIQTAALKMNI